MLSAAAEDLPGPAAVDSGPFNLISARRTPPGLFFGGLADAVDGVADRGREQLKERCRGALELSHCVLQPVARDGGAFRRLVYHRERVRHQPAEVLGLLKE